MSISETNILTSLPTNITNDRPDATVYHEYIDGEWKAVDRTLFASLVDNAAMAMETLGIEPGDRIAVFSSNRAGCLVADFGAYSLRAIPVSLYSTSSTEQVRYILNDSGARLIFVGNNSQLAAVREIATQCPRLQHIIGLSDTSILYTYDAADHKAR
ncbi:MAG: AMP-binding protein, partial [Muribaculaceae bacterium]|nr:AMP-binding protein [Muribaculaceae bacterium]